MTRWLTTLALAAGFTTTASAVEGLQWDWSDGTEHRFLLRTDVQLAEVLWIHSDVGRQARVVGFALDVVTRCTGGEPAGRNGYNLTCVLEDIALVIDEAPSEPGIMEGLAVEIDELYTGKPVEMVMKHDGRITRFEVTGIDQNNRRIDQFHQQFREMLRRAFATMEVRLPRKGSTRGGTDWREVGTMAMEFPSLLGTMGRADVNLTITGVEDGQASVEVAAEGILGTGEMITIGGVERPKNQYDMRMVGEAVFDTNAHHLVSQQYIATGTTTASSQLGEGQSHAYRQRSEGRIIDANATVRLPDSGERVHAVE